MENSIVSEAGATWLGLPRSEEGHVIMLYQCGSSDPKPINPSASYVNAGEDQDPSLCNSGLSPPPEAVYNEPGKDLQCVSIEPGVEICT